MDGNKGAVNRKMQVVGLGTRSREEGRNLKVHFKQMIYNLLLHPKLIYKFQFEESLGIYQTYFWKQKDFFHSSTKSTPWLYRLGLKIRILMLISGFGGFFGFFFFSFW